MGFTDGVLRWLFGLLLTSVLVDCLPPTARPGKPSAGGAQKPGPVKQPGLGLKPVVVRCHESDLEVVVDTDLYGTGALINGLDLRLGQTPLAKGAQPGAKCGAFQSGDQEFTVRIDLTDCDTQVSFTGDAMVYTNVLVYSPTMIYTDVVIRMEGFEVPVECHYGRRYSVSGGMLVPTWVPFTSTQTAEDYLELSLRLVTDELHSERHTNVYHLGDVIYMEASVTQSNHVPLRVFVDYCIATLDPLIPDMYPDPEYIFIDYGCFLDAKLTGSGSHFATRTQENQLLLQLEAFRFRKDPRSSIYFSCFLKAEPAALNEQSVNRACSFIDGRWRSADGMDNLCHGCGGVAESSYPSSKSTQLGVQKRGTDADTVIRKTVTLGPLIVTTEEESSVDHVAEKPGTSVGARMVKTVKSGAEDPSAVVTEAGVFLDAQKMLPTEEGSGLEDPSVLSPRQAKTWEDAEIPTPAQAGAATMEASAGPAGPAAILDTPALVKEQDGSSESPEVLKTGLSDSPVGPSAVNTNEVLTLEAENKQLGP
ncbi:hypothetical protein AGOR_G00243740 [Albula goreensis]|uniref:Zona pellucida sperm-binding protein 3 n=1 Tax=Albula goreensis TaxID=1534307 RepID=A0A8T3CFC4_9TELE|nr:hypothetical protein AGOR_G00243740 [Albula goreensis]